MAEGEERPHRKQVAIGLVLNLTEPAVRFPQVEGSAEPTHGVDREVELGVSHDQAGLLQEHQSGQDRADGKEP